MQLRFELNDAEHQNVFLALLSSGVSEQVLLALIWHLKINDTILAEEMDGHVRYELAKCYQKTICEGERFVILDCHQTGREAVTYGVWLEEKELIALFKMNDEEENRRVSLATGYWGGEWVPWAKKGNSEWQSNTEGACRSGALAHHAVRRIGQCVDEYECLFEKG